MQPIGMFSGHVKDLQVSQQQSRAVHRLTTATVVHSQHHAACIGCLGIINDASMSYRKVTLLTLTVIVINSAMVAADGGLNLTKLLVFMTLAHSTPHASI